MQPILALLLGFFSLTVAASAFADQFPANHCEIFISKAQATASSHGIGGLRYYLQVGNLRAGEYVTNVGYYGSEKGIDQGNAPECHMSGSSTAPYSTVSLKPSNERHLEYVVEFRTTSGSVSHACPGHKYVMRAAFFVETNAHTYWLNPHLNSAELFSFDENGRQAITRDFGWFQKAPTTDYRLDYYNPGKCR